MTLQWSILALIKNILKLLSSWHKYEPYTFGWVKIWFSMLILSSLKDKLKLPPKNNSIVLITIQSSIGRNKDKTHNGLLKKDNHLKQLWIQKRSYNLRNIQFLTYSWLWLLILSFIVHCCMFSLSKSSISSSSNLTTDLTSLTRISSSYISSIIICLTPLWLARDHLVWCVFIYSCWHRFQYCSWCHLKVSLSSALNPPLHHSVQPLSWPCY